MFNDTPSKSASSLGTKPSALSRGFFDFYPNILPNTIKTLEQSVRALRHALKKKAGTYTRKTFRDHANSWARKNGLPSPYGFLTDASFYDSSELENIYLLCEQPLADKIKKEIQRYVESYPKKTLWSRIVGWWKDIEIKGAWLNYYDLQGKISNAYIGLCNLQKLANDKNNPEKDKPLAYTQKFRSILIEAMTIVNWPRYWAWKDLIVKFTDTIYNILGDFQTNFKSYKNFTLVDEKDISYENNQDEQDVEIYGSDYSKNTRALVLAADRFQREPSDKKPTGILGFFYNIAQWFKNLGKEKVHERSAEQQRYLKFVFLAHALGLDSERTTMSTIKKEIKKIKFMLHPDKAKIFCPDTVEGWEKLTQYLKPKFDKLNQIVAECNDILTKETCPTKPERLSLNDITQQKEAGNQEYLDLNLEYVHSITFGHLELLKTIEKNINRYSERADTANSSDELEQLEKEVETAYRQIEKEETELLKENIHVVQSYLPRIKTIQDRIIEKKKTYARFDHEKKSNSPEPSPLEKHGLFKPSTPVSSVDDGLRLPNETNYTI